MSFYFVHSISNKAQTVYTNFMYFSLCYNYTTLNAFAILNFEQIASVAETDPDRRRRLERLLSKLEFKKMEIVKRTEAKAMVEGAKARNDEAEVDRIKAKFASDMQLLAKSADSEKKRQKAR